MDDNKVDNDRKKRIKILFFIFTFIFLLLIARLAWIQIINNEEYYNKALKQRMKELKVNPDRGKIYDINGKELAVSIKSKTVVGLPKQISHPTQTAGQLADILSIGYETLLNRLKRDAYAVYLERKIPDQKVQEIKDLKLDGITFIDESKRIYPKDKLASQLVGFVGVDGNGLEGIELTYNKYLTGNAGRILTERDAAGKMIPEGIIDYIPEENGSNLYLTINEAIQHSSERELAKAAEEYKAAGGTIIIMEPETGNILSMANYPTYDPNNFSQYKQKYWRNRAITDNYEPGSTFKIITTASAIEEGVVNKNDVFFDSGKVKVEREYIQCWEEEGHGKELFSQVVQNSCNPGFVQVGLRMGKDSFYKYIDAFGFGQKTEIELPGEAIGLIPDYEQIGDIELATISFGRGISVTPIQLITAVSAVANDGVLMKPNFIDRITNQKGKVEKRLSPTEVRKVVSSRTAHKTLNLLENVVSNGTGVNAYIEGYRVGGKTGTAQYYNQDKYDSSFIGIFPVNDPQFVVLVVLYGIEGNTYYASQTAAPLFKKIANDLIRYYKLPSQEKQKEPPVNETLKLADYSRQNLYNVKNTLKELGLEYKIVGNGNEIIDQIPKAGSEVYKNSTVFLFTEKSDSIAASYRIMTPDFRGMEKKEALNLAEKMGIKLKFQGQAGQVVGQSVDPGLRIDDDKEVILKLKG
ncbi:MAG TPA: penicillin-binding transpeptidase domain-containing protein [Halanaerobiales bacterium]|nr:penicillin-binding transpeptidase domain-containing protein [Halanaerobiales bacterium]